MTQEELELVFNRLHEKYRYERGELINKKNNASIGTMSEPSLKKGHAHLMVVLSIDMKVFCMPLSHAIWIYHFKEKPRYILFKDGNRMNCMLENLKPATIQEIQFQFAEANQGFKKCGNKFRVCIRASDYEGSLGAYDTEETAKEIYLLAKKILLDEPMGIRELREKICTIHPLAKKYVEPKRIMPFTYFNKSGRFDCKFNFKGHSLFLGTFDDAIDAHNEALHFKEQYKKNPSILDKYLNRVTNKTGVRNVYEAGDGYFVIITLNKKTHKLGPFKTKKKQA